MLPTTPRVHPLLTCPTAVSLSGPVVPVTCRIRGNWNAKGGSCTGYISISSPCFGEHQVCFSQRKTYFIGGMPHNSSFPLSALSSPFTVTFISSWADGEITRIRRQYNLIHAQMLTVIPRLADDRKVFYNLWMKQQNLCTNYYYSYCYW